MSNAQIEGRSKKRKPTPVAVVVEPRNPGTRKQRRRRKPNPFQVRLRRSAYIKYLRSPEWKAKRAAVIERDKTCRGCGSTHHLQVHHLTYERIFVERLDDLTLLCDECHARAHRA